MLFGFGVWLWCLPALVLLTYLARRDTTALWAHIGTPPSTASGGRT
jgi:hypothetical protein